MQIKQALLATTLTALIGGGVAMGETDRTSGTQAELKFKFDSSALPTNAGDALHRVAALSMAHPELRIVLDGNADPIGTAEYNVGLSIRRAEAVRDQLVGLGVDRDKIIVSAYGKDAPRRATYADDRRVTVWTTRNSVASVIDHTFAYRGTAVTWEKPMTTAQIASPSEPVASR
jgi:outer membrane protein OmpA-like peptidoglycan-associated protein